MERVSCLQEPHSPEEIDARIIWRYEILYDAFFEERDLIPDGRFHEIRFEDLERDPVAEIRRLYEGLDIPGFEVFRPALENYVRSKLELPQERVPEAPHFAAQRDLASLEAELRRVELPLAIRVPSPGGHHRPCWRWTEDEIHVWRVGVASAYTRRDVLWSFLAGDERQKATDFLFDDDRERFIVSEGCCGRSWGVTCASILGFAYNAYGKPRLAGDFGIRFSTSHSHGLILLAFARDRDVGVDIERVRADLGLEEIAASWFSPREIATLHSLRNDLREQAFFACWTRKEALAKAEGKGLALPLCRFP